jgi:hypothetical protein
VSAPVVDMDDPLAQPGPRDTPPQPRDLGDAAGNPPPAPSTPPKRKRISPDAQLKSELKEIEDALTALLEIPGLPMAATGDTWAAQHVEAHAGKFAKAIAQSLKDNPKLRARILTYLRMGENAGLAVAAGTYLIPILIYYGIIPIPPPAKAVLNIPDRDHARGESIFDQMRAQAEYDQHNGQTGSPPPTNEPPPPGQPPTPRATPAI